MPPDMFQTLDDLVNSALLLALIGREFTGEQPERMLLVLPVRLGGMAIPMLEKTASDEHTSSLHVTESGVKRIAVKSDEFCESGNDSRCHRQDPALEALSACCGLVRHECCRRSREMADKVECLTADLSKRQKLLTGTAEEKGASSWLPLKCKTMLKSDFWDAVCLRYDIPIDRLSTSCVCQAEVTVDHAFA